MFVGLKYERNALFNETLISGIAVLVGLKYRKEMCIKELVKIPLWSIAEY